MKPLRSSHFEARPTALRGLVACAALALCAALAPSAHAQRRHRPRRPAPATPTPATPPAATPSATTPTNTPPSDDDALRTPALGPGAAAPAPRTNTPVAPLTATPTRPAHDHDDDARRPGRRYLDAFVAFAPFARSFTYADDLFNRLRPYTLNFAPAIAAQIAWFPGAHFTAGPGSWFGIAADGSYTLGLSSRDGANNRFATTAFSYSVGLVGRIPLGPAELGLRVAWAQQRFALEPAGATQPGVPSVDYQLVRIALEGRVALGRRFALLARGGYDVVLSSGELISTSYFPRGSAGAGHAGLGFAVPLIAGLELRLMVDARRYFFAFDPQPGDRNVAGGALDQYLTGSVGFALRR